MQEVRSKWHLQLTFQLRSYSKVWSPVAGKTLKFEQAAFEKESIGVTTANTWQELSFDFTG
jgi:hypothetical protein